MVRLSQSWKLRYPLLDWHGNNGSITGDGAAKMRYCEVRLGKISEDGMLAGIKKENVDFMDNYDETTKEPVTLPSFFPNLLCNPNDGIGVSISSSWLPHNLGEVAEAIYTYMDGGEPSLAGPDFPLGGRIINADAIPAMLKTGKGSVKLRGQFKINKNIITFHEIPYGVTIERILDQINECCESKKISGIADARDESNKAGIKIVIHCEKTANPALVVNQLFFNTDLQTTVYYNQVALVDKTPVLLNLEDCCRIYVEHGTDCIKREAQFDLTKAADRLHIIDGLLIALEDIDNVIALIKRSESAAAAKTKLEEKYKLSDAQSKAILAMRLSSLANLEKVELMNEKKDLVDKISELNVITSSFDRQKEILRERLAAIVKKFGDKRRTELDNITISKSDAEIACVPEEEVVVTLTEGGNIKRVPKSSFKIQSRGGTGKKNVKEVIKSVINTNTVEYLYAFTKNGMVYKFLVGSIPEKEVNIASLIKVPSSDSITTLCRLSDNQDDKYIIFITKLGMIKKTLSSEYQTSLRSGLKALNLKEGDEVLAAFVSDDAEVALFTREGKGTRFNSAAAPAYGRVAKGVMGIRLSDGDEVVSAFIITDEGNRIGVFTEQGLGFSFVLTDMPPLTRGAKGIKVADSKSTVAGALLLKEDDNIMIVTSGSTLCIKSADIPVYKKCSKGVILAKSNIITVTKI